MFEAVDAFVDFEVNPTMMCEGSKVVFVNKFLWDVAEFDPDVFGAVQWRAQVEIGNVEAGKFPVWS